MNRSPIRGKIFVFLVIFFLFRSEASEDIVIDQTWLNLLHYDGKHSEVTTGNFFLSESRRPKDELTVLIQKLKTRPGYDLACRFPARYNYLKTKTNLPNYDLSQCEELQKFKASVQSNNLSLVMAGEYPNSPASAFGHVMLVFHNSKKPVADADAIHFAAVTEGRGSFMKYAANGIFGNFDGYFFREPLFKKVNEYANQEQRYVFYFHLKANEEQRQRLVDHLFELRDQAFRYYFIKNNCGYQIERLLNITFADQTKDGFFYTLPLDVVLNYESKVDSITYDPPLIARAKSSIAKLNSQQLALFDQLNSSGHNAEAEKDNNVVQAVNLYQNYLFRTGQRTNKHFTRLVELNYTPKEDNPHIIRSPLERSKPERLQLMFRKPQEGKNSVSLQYRPALIDKYDNQLVTPAESEQTLFDWDVDFYKDKVALRKLNFINYRVMPHFSYYFRGWSWQVYSGLNRDNRQSDLAWSTNFGVGQTFNLGKGFVFNYIVGPNLDVQSQTYGGLYSSLRLYTYLGDLNKFIYELKYKEYFSGSFVQHEFSYVRYINQFGLVFDYKHQNEKGHNEYGLGFQYHF